MRLSVNPTNQIVDIGKRILENKIEIRNKDHTQSTRCRILQERLSTDSTEEKNRQVEYSQRNNTQFKTDYSALNFR
jgi:hypothetical protein